MTRIVPTAPPEVRAAIRANHHPARAVACPWCHATPGKPCRRKRGATLPTPHPIRAGHWARETATCPTCQAEPGTPCQFAAITFTNDNTHPQRIDQALHTETTRREAS